MTYCFAENLVVISKRKWQFLSILLTNYFFHLPYNRFVQEVRKIYHIYIEYFFLLNFVFLYSIWNITETAISCSVTQKKLLWVSLIGAVMCCLFLFLPVKLWYRLLIGAVCTFFVSIFLLFGKGRGYKGYLHILGVIFASSIALGGSIGLMQKWGWIQSFFTLKTTAFTLLFSFGSKRFLRKLLLSKQKLIYPVTLVWEERSISMLALLDTGNGLIDPISKKPVCIVGKNVFEEMKAKEGGRKGFQPQKFRVIPYHSVGKNNGILYGFEMNRLIIDTDERKVIIEKPVIGISDVPVGKSNSYQMILQPELLREGVNRNDIESIPAR